MRVPNFEWIADDRTGLTLCDATSAVFAQEMDWAKLDVVTFSWQKCLGGEAAHGVLILSPRAVERARSYTPTWPVPKLFRFVRDGVLDEALFEGQTINTPSMLCVEDCQQAVAWAEAAGGLKALQARVRRNAGIVSEWVAASEWAADPVADPATRSLTSVVITVSDPAFAHLDEAAQRRFIAAMAALLEAEGAAYDIAGHRGAPPGLRIWTGATIEAEDLRAVLPWLDWVYRSVRLQHTVACEGVSHNSGGLRSHLPSSGIALQAGPHISFQHAVQGISHAPSCLLHDLLGLACGGMGCRVARHFAR